mmetsp:Transcript_146766/g.471146  ORF Transcript_146766/g.471146 Transcript_146766/m.471146 type:complete len:207 (+) Transcript_146766:1036-1656(+)
MLDSNWAPLVGASSNLHFVPRSVNPKQLPLFLPNPPPRPLPLLPGPRPTARPRLPPLSPLRSPASRSAPLPPPPWTGGMQTICPARKHGRSSDCRSGLVSRPAEQKRHPRPAARHSALPPALPGANPLECRMVCLVSRELVLATYSALLPVLAGTNYPECRMGCPACRVLARRVLAMAVCRGSVASRWGIRGEIRGGIRASSPRSH